MIQMQGGVFGAVADSDAFLAAIQDIPSLSKIPQPVS
jgi:hypothetical protein